MRTVSLLVLLSFCAAPRQANASYRELEINWALEAGIWMSAMTLFTVNKIQEANERPLARWNSAAGWEKSLDDFFGADNQEDLDAAESRGAFFLWVATPLVGILSFAPELYQVLDGDLPLHVLLEDFYTMATATWLAVTIQEALKINTGRVRPDAFPAEDGKVDKVQSIHSFPSGHAMMPIAISFSISTVFHRRGYVGWWIPGAIGATLGGLVGWHRLIKRAHWGTDVLAAWALGAAIGIGYPLLTRTLGEEVRISAGPGSVQLGMRF